MKNVKIEITGQIGSCSQLKKELTNYKSVKGLRFGGFELTYTCVADAEADLATAFENITLEEGEDAATLTSDFALRYDAATAQLITY